MRHIYFLIILLKAALNYSSKLLAISTTYYLYLWSEQESVCDKNNAPSVSSISRVLRGGHVSELCTSGDEGRTNHSIDGILGKPKNSARHFNCIWSVLAVTCMVRVKYVICFMRNMKIFQRRFLQNLAQLTTIGGKKKIVKLILWIYTSNQSSI